MNKLEQAARALLAHWDTPAWKYLKPTGDLMADLREALSEQAEQEPVAWWNGKETAWFEHELDGHPAPDGCTIPLYAAPVRIQEPIGYLYNYRNTGEVFIDVFAYDFENIEFNCGYNIRPLYATPVRTKDLTDDEIMECDGRICANTDWGRKKMFARAVIAADREKNNPLTKSNKGE